MSAIYILIGASIIVAAGFLIGFIWSVRSGQFEDDYTPSVRVLFDDEIQSPPKDLNQESKTNKKSENGSRKNLIR